MLTSTSTTAQSERLRSIPLFAGLSQPGLRHVAAAAAEVEVPPGRLIIERGQPGSGIFVILEGTVSVELPGRVVSLGPPQVVGELSMLAPGARRSARVRAETRVWCLALSRSSVDDLLATEPGFAAAVAETAALRAPGSERALRRLDRRRRLQPCC